MGRIRFGTSGFSYKEWRPAFYPADLRESGFLRFYATRFNSVEIDSTFYRMPNAKTIDGWKNATGEDFQFVNRLAQGLAEFVLLCHCWLLHLWDAASHDAACALPKRASGNPANRGISERVVGLLGAAYSKPLHHKGGQLRPRTYFVSASRELPASPAMLSSIRERRR